MSIELNTEIYKIKKKSGKLVLNLFNKGITNINEIIGLENIKDLQVLKLNGNQITEIRNLDPLKNLEELYLNRNQISHIEGIENLQNLRILDLSKNKIKKAINLNNHPKLQIVDLNDNEISELEILKGLPELESLKMHGNPIYQSIYKRFISPFSLGDKFFIEYGKNSIEDRIEAEKTFKLKIESHKYRGKELSEYITMIDQYLDDNYKSPNNIFYPIEGSELFAYVKNFVDKEEILYSTLCNVQFYCPGPLVIKFSYQTHVFLTRNGMIFTFPLLNISASGFTELYPVRYLNWDTFRNFKPSTRSYPYEHKKVLFEIKFDKLCIKINAEETFTIARAIHYESKENFRKRMVKFSPICRILWVRAILSNPPIYFWTYHKYLNKLNGIRVKKKISTVLKEIHRSQGET